MTFRSILLTLTLFFTACSTAKKETIQTESSSREIASQKWDLLSCRELFLNIVKPKPKFTNSQEELNAILERTNFNGSEVMSFLSRTSDLKKLFEASAGVSEGYSIREHTQMVYDTYLEQLPYFKISSVKTSENINIKRLYRFIISIHDIGKPIAIAKEGKHAQHKYTRPIVEETMQRFGFSESEISLAISLIDNDILGDVMQGFISPNRALLKIESLAEKNSMSVQDYFQLQSFFYIVDAASYPGLRELVFHEVNGKLVPKPKSFHELADLVKKQN